MNNGEASGALSCAGFWKMGWWMSGRAGWRSAVMSSAGLDHGERR